MSRSIRDFENEVKSWGFKRVFTWTDEPWVFQFATNQQTCDAYYHPHSHSGLTTHLIMDGQLTITYPNDKSPTRETFGPGARIDVPAGKVHEVWIGPSGCTYIIGE